MEKLFKQKEQIPLTISKVHVILKFRCGTSRIGNQLKQTDKIKKLLTKKQPHDILYELPVKQTETKCTLKTED